MSRIFMKGCEAIAEAAVRAGCRFFAGYPITPQNEIPEYFARRMPEVGGVFVQGASEVASVNMVYGAASAGTRSMTSSSSCGISLKSEGISYCASARVPMVYCNVQRGGPGVGAIQPAQQDYFQCIARPLPTVLRSWWYPERISPRIMPYSPPATAAWICAFA